MNPVTELEIVDLERLLEESHQKHAAAGIPVKACTNPKCVEARWGIGWLRRCRGFLYGSVAVERRAPVLARVSPHNACGV